MTDRNGPAVLNAVRAEQVRRRLVSAVNEAEAVIATTAYSSPIVEARTSRPPSSTRGKTCSPSRGDAWASSWARWDEGCAAC